MKLVFLFLFCSSIYAQDFDKHYDGIQLRENKGQISVLEAPLFAAPSKDAKVVQYFRRGQEIYIHPAEFQIDRYKDVVDVNEDEVQDYKKSFDQNHQDPLFAKEEDVYYPDPSSLFYKTMASSGRDAWILKDHVFLLFHDLRELDQEIATPDPTDYRIKEPLPKDFPFIRPTGRRGQVSVGLGIPNYSSYDYPTPINDSGYGFLKEFSFIWQSNIEFEVERRLFFGGLINIVQGTNDYKLDGRQAEESTFRLSAGPIISYDVWRNEQYRLNLHTSLQFAFIDYVEIKQFSADESDTRNFSSYNFAPRAGVNLQKPGFLYALDLIVGINLNLELPREFKTSDSANKPQWWNSDSFDRDSSIQTTYFLGLQTSY
ncbi:MAG: hypothetical protein KC478_07365 [Bacteriovoracaceae bacterium]|nr:hypothetical protein [Bacteriovoracaceae bacterium]